MSVATATNFIDNLPQAPITERGLPKVAIGEVIQEKLDSIIALFNSFGTSAKPVEEKIEQAAGAPSIEALAATEPAPLQTAQPISPYVQALAMCAVAKDCGIRLAEDLSTTANYHNTMLTTPNMGVEHNPSMMMA